MVPIKTTYFPANKIIFLEMCFYYAKVVKLFGIPVIALTRRIKARCYLCCMVKGTTFKKQKTFAELLCFPIHLRYAGHTMGRYHAQIHNIDPDYDAWCPRSSYITPSLSFAQSVHIVCRVMCWQHPEESWVNRHGSRIGSSSSQCLVLKNKIGLVVNEWKKFHSLHVVILALSSWLTVLMSP